MLHSLYTKEGERCQVYMTQNNKYISNIKLNVWWGQDYDVVTESEVLVVKW